MVLMVTVLVHKEFWKVTMNSGAIYQPSSFTFTNRVVRRCKSWGCRLKILCGVVGSNGVAAVNIKNDNSYCNKAYKLAVSKNFALCTSWLIMTQSLSWQHPHFKPALYQDGRNDC